MPNRPQAVTYAENNDVYTKRNNIMQCNTICDIITLSCTMITLYNYARAYPYIIIIYLRMYVAFIKLNWEQIWIFKLITLLK